MVMAMGVGASAAGMFHLTTHAFFKALLFLGAGSVIHAVHTQEMPLMGGLRKKMPITFVTFFIATLAISGVPFFSGFYSKDAILAGALAFGMQGKTMIPFILALAAAGITAFYMFRMLFMTFMGKPRDEERYSHAHESPWTMSVPLMVLAVLAIVSAGWKGPADSWFSKFVTSYDLPAITAEYGHQENHIVESDHHVVVDDHAVVHVEEHATSESDAAHGDSHGDAHDDVSHKAHSMAMVMSIAIAGLGIFLSWLAYMKKAFSTEAIKTRLNPVYKVLQNKYYFDEIYAATVYKFVLGLAWLNAAFDRVVIDGIVNGSATVTKIGGWITGSIFDRYVVDGMVNGVGNLIQGAGQGMRRVQTGRVQTYLLYVCTSIVILVFVFRAL